MAIDGVGGMSEGEVRDNVVNDVSSVVRMERDRFPR